MSRTKGAKDKTPRRINPASLAALRPSIPGHASKSLRIYAPSSDVRWFEQLQAVERGSIITKARKCPHCGQEMP